MILYKKGINRQPSVVDSLSRHDKVNMRLKGGFTIKENPGDLKTIRSRLHM
jgi:hypothetical protein